MEIKTAIEVMEDVMKQYSRRRGVQEAITMAINALEEVEKHEETFEWCTGCKEYDCEKHCCHRWCKVIRETAKEIKETLQIVDCQQCIHRNTDKCPADKDFVDRNLWFYCGNGEKHEKTDD